jgi:tetratricopeptide (TPR) repeat protein
VARSYQFSFVERDLAKGLQELQAGLRLAPADPTILSSLAGTEMRTGQMDSALVHARRAAELDPRSARAAWRYGVLLRLHRRYPDAIVALDHALAITPADLNIRENRVMVALQQGDLAGARAVLHAAPREVDPGSLVAYIGAAWDLAWVLDDDQQRALLQLSPASFDDDRAAWAIVLAQTLWLRGDQAGARAYADTAQATFDVHLRDAPDDPQLHVIRGLGLAYMGRKAEAMREAERGLALTPAADRYNHLYYEHLLAKVYLLVGEPEKALDQLEPLLQAHYDLTPGWLRIDPNFAALRGNPRFERLARGE